MNQTKKFPQISLAVLRIFLGWLMLNAGWEKISASPAWTAAGYLQKATKGPFKDMFMSMAGSGVVDGLVVWGEILIGICLILGVLVRWASFWSIVQMLLFWASALPPDHGLVDERIIYVFVLLVFMAFGAGTVFGLDAYLESTEFVKAHPKVKLLLG